MQVRSDRPRPGVRKVQQHSLRQAADGPHVYRQAKPGRGLPHLLCHDQNPVYEGEYRGRRGRTDDGGGGKTGNRGKRRAGKREKDCLRGRSFLLS